MLQVRFTSWRYGSSIPPRGERNKLKTGNKTAPARPVPDTQVGAWFCCKLRHFHACLTSRTSTLMHHGTRTLLLHDIRTLVVHGTSTLLLHGTSVPLAVVLWVNSTAVLVALYHSTFEKQQQTSSLKLEVVSASKRENGTEELCQLRITVAGLQDGVETLEWHSERLLRSCQDLMLFGLSLWALSYSWCLLRSSFYCTVHDSEHSRQWSWHWEEQQLAMTSWAWSRQGVLLKDPRTKINRTNQTLPEII